MAEERKVEFAGNGIIKKCPNCGAQLEAFQARCPACGFAIGGEEKGGSAALKNFLDMYTSEKDNARKLEMINTFPIPNTIEDTIEFALLAAQQVKSYTIRQEETGSAGGGFVGLKDMLTMTVNGATAGKMVTNTDFRIAWQNKLEQICYRAKFAYPQEKEKLAQLDMLVEDVKDKDKKAKEKEKKEKKDDNAFFVVFFIVLLGIFIGLGVSLFKTNEGKKLETQRLENLMTEIQADISKENYDDAEIKLSNLTWNIDGREEKKVWKEKQNILKKQIEKNKEKAGE